MCEVEAVIQLIPLPTALAQIVSLYYLTPKHLNYGAVGLERFRWLLENQTDLVSEYFDYICVGGYKNLARFMLQSGYRIELGFRLYNPELTFIPLSVGARLDFEPSLARHLVFRVMERGHIEVLYLLIIQFKLQALAREASDDFKVQMIRNLVRDRHDAMLEYALIWLEPAAIDLIPSSRSNIFNYAVRYGSTKSLDILFTRFNGAQALSQVDHRYMTFCAARHRRPDMVSYLNYRFGMHPDIKESGSAPEEG